MSSYILPVLFGLSSFVLANAQAGQSAIISDPAGSSAPLTFRLANDISPDIPYSRSSAQVGSITGRVFYGGPHERSGVDGVKLVLRLASDAGPFVREQVSDGTGNFSFEELSPGKYTLTIETRTLPEKFRLNASGPLPLKVEPQNETKCDIPVSAQRLLKGIVYLDRNGDSKYTPGKDQALDGALVSAEGALAVTDVEGAYTLENLPAGRVALLVQSSRKGTNASVHVVLDLGPGPVTNRVVNIPVQP